MNNPEEPSGHRPRSAPGRIRAVPSHPLTPPRFRWRRSPDGEIETKSYNGPQIMRCGRAKNWPPSPIDGTINLGIFLNTSSRYYTYNSSLSNDRRRAFQLGYIQTLLRGHGVNERIRSNHHPSTPVIPDDEIP